MKNTKKLTPSSVEAYGGKFVIRGNPVQVMEGSWNYDRLVLLEFPSKEIALEWYNSKEYQKAKKIREKASSANFFYCGLVFFGIFIGMKYKYYGLF
ncbi:DUF1330 domain-containing protein [Algoriphagus boritolerans]|uniref:DUF1330 domain-containing protein n=1 Tax=Algoriphagus boritolerans TaxID=308111 RepID=UPI000AC592AD